MENLNTRYVMILENDSVTWTKHSFLDVKEGNIFTIWEEDGIQVMYGKSGMYKAIEDAYINDYGIYTVKYEDFNG